MASEKQKIYALRRLCSKWKLTERAQSWEKFFTAFANIPLNSDLVRTCACAAAIDTYPIFVRAAGNANATGRNVDKTGEELCKLFHRVAPTHASIYNNLTRARLERETEEQTNNSESNENEHKQEI